MKQYRAKNGNLLDKQAIVNKCVETVDGLEAAHINLATGEITYSKTDTCIDDSLLCDVFAKAGVELEEVK